MLEYLRGKASHRKLRLFAVGCCLQVWHLIRDTRHRATVQAAEDFADGRIAVGALRVARSAAWAAEDGTIKAKPVRATVSDSAGAAAGQAQRQAVQLVWSHVAGSWGTAPDKKRKAQQCQSDLLRDIFGNPFRPVAISLACLTPQVVALAQAAYDQRELQSGHLDPVRLAILADALTDAGCDNEDLLRHCREQGLTHCRGCWVVDLILGKG
jgi:hypothetical protein